MEMSILTAAINALTSKALRDDVEEESEKGGGGRGREREISTYSSHV